MRSVPDQGNAALGGNPGGKRITVDELPVHEAVWGCCTDDGVDLWTPAFQAFECVLDLPRSGPGLFNVGFVLVRADPAEVFPVLD